MYPPFRWKTAPSRSISPLRKAVAIRSFTLSKLSVVFHRYGVPTLIMETMAAVLSASPNRAGLRPSVITFWPLCIGNAGKSGHETQTVAAGTHTSSGSSQNMAYPNADTGNGHTSTSRGIPRSSFVFSALVHGGDVALGIAIGVGGLHFGLTPPDSGPDCGLNNPVNPLDLRFVELVKLRGQFPDHRPHDVLDCFIACGHRCSMFSTRRLAIFNRS